MSNLPSTESTDRPALRAALRRLLAPAACALACAAAQADDVKVPWQLAGRLGIAQFIVVPEAMARDRNYYVQVIRAACETGTTCFLRFFTNSTNAPVTMPLPDAIEHESVAIYQRSAKMGREEFRFSCRLGLPENDCY